MSALLLCLLSVVACAAEFRAVATVSVVGDLLHQIAGPRVEVVVLVPGGADLHTRQMAPADAQAMAGARLVVANGLGLEPWLPGLVASSGYHGQLVEASAGVTPRMDGADPDPHAFQDVRNAQQYVKTIRDALIAVDATGAAEYRARADLLLAELGVLDAWVRRQVATVPAQRRVLVTPHDGLAYFAAAYGFELLPVEGEGHGHEPDAQRVSELVALVRARGLNAVFTEDGHSAGVITALARSAGTVVAGPLAADGPMAGQDYRAMIVSNTLIITAR